MQQIVLMEEISLFSTLYVILYMKTYTVPPIYPFVIYLSVGSE